MASRETQLMVRVTDDEKRRFEQAAQSRGLSLAAWVRMVCRDHSTEYDPVVREFETRDLGDDIRASKSGRMVRRKER